MHYLVGPQKGDLEHALSLASGSNSFNSLVLVGEHGAGKRTIAENIANAIGLDFMEVSARGNYSHLRILLFGSEVAAERAAETGTPPGELGGSRPTLLYFSDLQSVPLDFAHTLYQVLRTRQYADAADARWRLNSRLLLLGGLSLFDEAATIDLDHFLLTGFGHRIEIDPPREPATLESIAAAIWAERLPDVPVDPGLRELFPSVLDAPDNLHALRRWVGIAARESAGGRALSAKMIGQLPSLDLRYAIKGITYRGRFIGLDLLQSWLSQFPTNVRPLASELVRQISKRYYISQTTYFSALQVCVVNSGIRRRSTVSFCGWQQLGQSGPRVVNQLKNLAYWNITHDIDLNQETDRWPRFANGDPDWFILADDFVGSGDTLIDVTKGQLPRLLNRFPRSQVRILIAVGFREGLQRTVEQLRPWRNRVSIIPGLLFDDSDRCFTENSRILRKQEYRETLKAFCANIATKYFPGLLAQDRHLGWSKMGLIVVFSDTIPNNSLPLLWHDAGTWKPLFPASGLLPQDLS